MKEINVINLFIRLRFIKIFLLQYKTLSVKTIQMIRIQSHQEPSYVTPVKRPLSVEHFTYSNK